MEGAVTPGAGRQRWPLAEIPLWWLDTANQEQSPTPPTEHLNPVAMPDELIIQQRGRKRLPITWSPGTELKRNSTTRTPPKDNKSPMKLFRLRAATRRRLLLDTDGTSTNSRKDRPDRKSPAPLKAPLQRKVADGKEL